MTDPVTLPREDADLPSVMAALRPLGWKSEESLRQAAQAALRQSLASAPQEVHGHKTWLGSDYAASAPQVGGGLDADALANEIRRVDGDNSLGAGALAEALMPSLAALSQEAEPVAWRSNVLNTIVGIDNWRLTHEPYKATTGERVRAVQRLIVHPDDRGGEVKG